MEKYIRILQRMRAGRPISREEIRYFIEYSQDVDQAKLSRLSQKLSSGVETLTDQDVSDLIDQQRAQLTQGPYKEQVLQLAQDAERGRLSDKVTQGLNVLLAGTDIATSLGQIGAARGAERRLQQPQRPTVPGRDPALQRAISQAEGGTFDQQRALAPAQLQILDQYLADLDVARRVSTGQASQYGALAQTAANRRQRASLGLVPLQDQIRRQEQARLDALIGQRMGETQQRYENVANLYPTERYYSDLEAQRIGALGAQGRVNLRTALPAFAGGARDAIIDNLVNRKYNQIYNEMLPYGEKAADAAVQSQTWLDGFVNPQRNDGLRAQLDQSYF